MSEMSSRQALRMLLAGGLALLVAGGCAGISFSSYTGGGLPPGDTDIGGVVLASATTLSDTAAPSQAQVPVEGAQVYLYFGFQQVVNKPVGLEHTYVLVIDIHRDDYGAGFKVNKNWFSVSVAVGIGICVCIPVRICIRSCIVRHHITVV